MLEEPEPEPPFLCCSHHSAAPLGNGPSGPLSGVSLTALLNTDECLALEDLLFGLTILDRPGRLYVLGLRQAVGADQEKGSDREES